MADDSAQIEMALGVTDVPRDFVEVRGPDAVSWLHGQLSQDVQALAVGGSAWSFLLQPQGKVDALVRVTRTADDAMVLDTDAGWGDAVIARLNRFKLRIKAEVTALDWRCVAGRGTDDVPDGWPGDGAWLVEPGWRPGFEAIGPEVEAPEGFEVVDAERYEWSRVAAGFPAMGSELDESTIPNETGIVDRAVSFTKGCYTGQELVARIDSRGGNVPRHLRRLVLDPVEEPPPAGATVVVDGQEVGTVTSVAQLHPTGAIIGLGYVKRAVEPPVAAVFRWAEREWSGQVLLPRDDA